MLERYNSETVGPKLRDLRLTLGKTIAEVADETGIGATALSNYENGVRIPRDETKVQLARYYQTSVEEIFFSSR